MGWGGVRGCVQGTAVAGISGSGLALIPLVWLEMKQGRDPVVLLW